MARVYHLRSSQRVPRLVVIDVLHNRNNLYIIQVAILLSSLLWKEGT